MTNIAHAFDKVKNNLNDYLDPHLVHESCVAAGHTWRDRLLDPVTTLRLFILQVMHGNTACRTLPHLAKMCFSVTAYCNARSRLPLEVFRDVAACLIRTIRQQTQDFGRWLGHRVFLVDGTGISMPDEPALQEAFGQPGGAKPGCGFPVMHVLWLFDAGTGLVVDLIAGRWNRQDMADVARLHPSLGPGDVLVGDRGFCSFVHLSLVLQSNLHAVFRLHQRVITDFTSRRKARKQYPKRHRCGKPNSRFVKKLGQEDQQVEYRKPTSKPRWMSPEAFASLPTTIVVRELCYRVQQRGFRTQQVTLVTTLIDPERYSRKQLADLYQARWQVETNLCYLKQTMGLNVLRCKSRHGVLKELWVYALVYNWVRLIMLAAADRQGVSVDRISFIDALDCLRYLRPFDLWPKLKINPKRSARHQPRVIKRAKDCYPRMTRPRDELRQQLSMEGFAA